MPFSRWVEEWERLTLDAPLKDLGYEIKIAELLSRE